jgi:hypothetical protein
MPRPGVQPPSGELRRAGGSALAEQLRFDMAARPGADAPARSRCLRLTAGLSRTATSRVLNNKENPSLTLGAQKRRLRFSVSYGVRERQRGGRIRALGRPARAFPIKSWTRRRRRFRRGQADSATPRPLTQTPPAARPHSSHFSIGRNARSQHVLARDSIARSRRCSEAAPNDIGLKADVAIRGVPARGGWRAACPRRLRLHEPSRRSAGARSGPASWTGTPRSTTWQGARLLESKTL